MQEKNDEIQHTFMINNYKQITYRRKVPQHNQSHV